MDKPKHSLLTGSFLVLQAHNTMKPTMLQRSENLLSITNIISNQTYITCLYHFHNLLMGGSAGQIIINLSLFITKFNLSKYKFH